MNDLVRALAISAGIFLPIVVLIVIVSIAAVRRGEISLGLGDHQVPDLPHVHGQPVAAGAAAASATVAAPAKAPSRAAAAPAGSEISVPLILLLGLGLFTVTVVLLFLLSLVEHLL